jgi:perosamine synthetase
MSDNQPNEPIRQTMLPYGQQWLDEQDKEAVQSVLNSDFITQGPQIDRFERKVADYVGARYAVAFCNGTAALHAACFAAEIGPGDEVITTPITFLASSNCVLYMGGRPIFADIDDRTYNLDPDSIVEHISPRTKAIIPVDFTGQPVEIDRIMMLARDRGLVVIHDAAHSLGAEYCGRKIGAWGDMTMFSFHPVKHITTGEGGMIVTDNESYYKRLLLFRNHGMTRDPMVMSANEGAWYYEMHELGYNYRMTDLQAALGVSQMDKLDGFVNARRSIAHAYNEAFSELEGLITPRQQPAANSSWHLYVLRWELELFDADRRMIFEALRDENIGVNVHYIPVYQQPYYRHNGYADTRLPKAEAYYANTISLPIFPKMSENDVRDVILAVRKVHQQYF